MQAIYAYIQSENSRLDQGEKKLLESIDRIHQLYIWQLSFLREIVDFAQRRMEENSQKMLPTPEDLNPNTRFVNNRLVLSITENRDFVAYCNKYKTNWSLQDELIRKFYNELRSTEAYISYMESENSSFEDDREILLFLVRDMMVNFELLQYFYEDLDIHWVDDYDTVLVLLERTIKGWKENQEPHLHLPQLIKTNLDGEAEDRTFARQLYMKVLINSPEYDKIIEEKISNWEFDRVAKIDIILLRMAVCEFLEFPSIPVKVTINEYIDISKVFSSPKSKQFINGMLDKLALHFKETGLMNKIGRGLIDH